MQSPWTPQKSKPIQNPRMRTIIHKGEAGAAFPKLFGSSKKWQCKNKDQFSELCLTERQTDRNKKRISVELDKETFWRSTSELSLKRVRFKWSKNWCKGHSASPGQGVMPWSSFSARVEKMHGLSLILLYNALFIPIKGHISSADSLSSWEDPGSEETAFSPVFCLRYNELPSIPLIVGTLTSFGETDFEFSCLQ